jgi:hypothetical protein
MDHLFEKGHKDPAFLTDFIFFGLHVRNGNQEQGRGMVTTF